MTNFNDSFRTWTNFRWWILFLICFVVVYLSVTQLSKASLYGILNIFTVNLNEDVDDQLNRTDSEHRLLSSFTENENDFRSNQSKIYFVQTSSNADLLSRHACSIESAARLHPKDLIFVLMKNRYVHLTKGAANRLNSYSNIRWSHFTEDEIYSGTTLAQMKTIHRKQYIRYFAVSHMSDFIRTALLYKYGGVYFDLDVIPLKEFSPFRNAVALESIDGVNVAVLAFEKQHLALDIQMDIQLASIQNQLHTFCWNCVGPSALSDALKRVCDENILRIHDKDRCQQIDIQPSFVFYPIDYQEIPQFFRRSRSNDLIDTLLNNRSVYSIHFFHHMTMNLFIESQSPFARLAQKMCPNVYDQLLLDRSSQTISSKTKFTNVNVLLLCLCLSIVLIVILLCFLHLFSSLFPCRTLMMMKIPHRYLK